jgi:2-succinyl-6-hydroxy-2,4-cyclohexadiene-1-carboxylate synthase
MTNGILSYQTHGNSENTPIIFLHGFLGSSKDWTKIIDYFSDNYYCIAIDLPGHGDSLVLRDKFYTAEFSAFILKQLIDSFGLTQKAHLVGYSMGGRMAMNLAVRFPKLFDKIVIESATPGLATKKARKMRIISDQKLIDKLLEVGLHDFLRDWFDLDLFKSLKSHPDFEKIFNSRLDNDVKYLVKSLMGFGAGQMPSLWNLLKESNHEFLLIAGENDKKYRKILTILDKVLRKSKLKIIPNAAHNCHFENQAAYFNTLKEFFGVR